MVSRKGFAEYLATQDLSHVDRAIALLYYYRQTQQYEERSASDLADDLFDEEFPRPNVTRLRQALGNSPFTSRGSRPQTFRIDVRQVEELELLYGDVLHLRRHQISNYIVPEAWTAGTRTYLEEMVYQINASYDVGLYDASAVLMRRLMESLIIECYMSLHRSDEIRNNGVFIKLDRLIATIVDDTSIGLSRNAPKSMREVKERGDTAAHDRTYITEKIDIDDLKARFRRLIHELLTISGIAR